MLRIALICALGLTQTPPAWENPGLYLRGEYREDARDYESSVGRFYRLVSSLILSERSSLNLTLVRNADERESHTWSLVLADVSPGLYLAAGNFAARFGSGLVLGKPQAYNPDIFSSRGMSDERGVFSPVKSGNPSFAFNGLAASYRTGSDSITLDFHSFYSIAPRYLGEEDYYSSGTRSSLSTVQGSLERDHTHSEPAVIRTGGMMISLLASGAFLVEPYFVYTDLATADGRSIDWDREERDGIESSTRDVCGAGAALRYRDERIDVFVDYARSSTGKSREDRGDYRAAGDGIIGGARFSHPMLSMSLTLKRTHPGFFAPYQSTIGEHYPEKGVFLETELRPIKGIAAGASFSAQKKLLPSNADWELPYTTREKYYLRYSGRRIKSAELHARRYEKTSRGVSSRSEQAASALRAKIVDFLDAEASVTAQRSDPGGWAALTRTGLAARAGTAAELSIQYARTRIGGGERVYSVMAPMANSSIPGMFIDHTSHMFVTRLVVRLEGFHLAARYFRQWSHGDSAHRRMELSASGTF